MFRKILLPVDLTDKHGPALTAAAELAAAAKGSITLLHVIEAITGTSWQEEKDFYGRLQKAAKSHLAHLARGLPPGVPCQAEILIGKRAAEVVRFARDNGTDLIVLTAPRFDPAHPEAGWASLSHKISFLAPCPVLLVQ
jgi:nucleotide-binding universal stress UspA family protein